MTDAAKRFVYVLRSVTNPERRYVGLTADLPARLRAHNAGQTPSTSRWKPWVVDVCIEFRSARVALRFEKYLKSGSGHEFARRHFEDRS
jgi:predicted GIY-YIG superfamily endonuclease